MITQKTLAYFSSHSTNQPSLKKILILAFITSFNFAKAQKVDSIYVHLYTDSLKKGTYNYINIDGKLSDGHYIPLDTSDIIFTSDYGKFYGNSLWLDPDFKMKKVNIKATLRSNPTIFKEFDIYIKKIPDPAKLKTQEEIFRKEKKE